MTSRTPAPVVVVAGVPGSGKTFALRQVAEIMPHAVVLDPEYTAAKVASRLPARTPYRAYRPLVHLLYWLGVVRALIVGPTTTPLVVHDPGTRSWLRRLVAGQARRRQREAMLILLDVDHAEALWGQHARGRLVPAQSFDRHWQRWNRLCRTQFSTLKREGWHRARLTTRGLVVGDIIELAERTRRDAPAAASPARRASARMLTA